MTTEISDKLLELTRYCTERGITIEFLRYGAQRNVMEETIRHGERLVQIELGRPEDETLFTDLTNFFDKIKE